MMRRFLLSRAALPASSRISADRYSSTAARYTTRVPRMRNTHRHGMGKRMTWCTRTDTAAEGRFSQHTMDTADGELKASSVRARLACLFPCSALDFTAELSTFGASFCGHVDRVVEWGASLINALFILPRNATGRVVTRHG